MDNLSIGTSNIANDAVTTGKILDGTITNNDIAAAAGITAAKLQSNIMIESENISLLNNDAGYITSVTTTEITDGTIQNADINGRLLSKELKSIQILDLKIFKPLEP